jgi:transcription elongation GreA/GreB family factor
LNSEEFENWKSQFVTSNADKMGLRRPPYAFTEQGVAMLSAILKSETAITVSIQIMKAFVEMRHYVQQNDNLLYRINYLEEKQQFTDARVNQLFAALDKQKLPPEKGIFFELFSMNACFK